MDIMIRVQDLRASVSLRQHRRVAGVTKLPYEHRHAE